MNKWMQNDWYNLSEDSLFDPYEMALGGGIDDLYDPDEAHLERLRQSIADQIFPDSKTNAGKIETVFCQMADTPTGRTRLLRLPETTKYACKRFTNPNLMGMSYVEKMRVEIAALYPFDDMELLDTMAHEQTHLVHGLEARQHVDKETPMDTFCLKVYDEIGARLTGAKVCAEASQGQPDADRFLLTVTDILTTMNKAGYFDDYAQDAAQERVTSADQFFKHGPTFNAKLRYFQHTYDELASPSLLNKIEHLYLKHLEKYLPQETPTPKPLHPEVLKGFRNQR